MHLQNVLPADIEKRSMEIIGEELGQIRIDPEKIDIVKRVIHTSADFDYARNMLFSDGVVEKALECTAKGATIVTDTNMACYQAINKWAWASWAQRLSASWQIPMLRHALRKQAPPEPLPAWKRPAPSRPGNHCRRQCTDRTGSSGRAG